jgi:hypothetical protein
MKYLLDTNVLRHYTDGHQTLLDNLASVPLEQVAVPFIEGGGDHNVRLLLPRPLQVHLSRILVADSVDDFQFDPTTIGQIPYLSPYISTEHHSFESICGI